MKCKVKLRPISHQSHRSFCAPLERTYGQCASEYTDAKGTHYKEASEPLGADPWFRFKRLNYYIYLFILEKRLKGYWGCPKGPLGAHKPWVGDLRSGLSERQVTALALSTSALPPNKWYLTDVHVLVHADYQFAGIIKSIDICIMCIIICSCWKIIFMVKSVFSH